MSSDDRMPLDQRLACELDAERSGDPLLAWPAFAAHVRDRLDVGRETYGDKSFGRSGPSTLAELEQEALDLAGWGFVLWHRLRRMRHALEALEVDAGRKLARSAPSRACDPQIEGQSADAPTARKAGA